jgi:hypothetical protein
MSLHGNDCLFDDRYRLPGVSLRIEAGGGFALRLPSVYVRDAQAANPASTAFSAGSPTQN